MREVTEACLHLDALALPGHCREPFKRVLERVTRLVNAAGFALGVIQHPIREARLNDIWQGEAKNVYSREMDSMRAARITHAALTRDTLDARDQLFERLSQLGTAMALCDENRPGKRAVRGRQRARPLVRDNRLRHRPVDAT